MAVKGRGFFFGGGGGRIINQILVNLVKGLNASKNQRRLISINFKKWDQRSKSR